MTISKRTTPLLIHSLRIPEILPWWRFGVDPGELTLTVDIGQTKPVNRIPSDSLQNVHFFSSQDRCQTLPIHLARFLCISPTFTIIIDSKRIGDWINRFHYLWFLFLWFLYLCFLLLPSKRPPSLLRLWLCLYLRSGSYRLYCRRNWGTNLLFYLLFHYLWSDNLRPVGLDTLAHKILVLLTRDII